MMYASRFYVVPDIFHRLYEVATLLPLATAVLHIRTVPILSALAHQFDMFAYSVSIALAVLLNLLRSAEVMLCQHVFHTQGLFPEAYHATQRDLIWGGPSFLLAVASATYAGLEYYGNNDNDENHPDHEQKTDSSYHRIVAETTEPQHDDDDDIAIWLSLAGPMASLLVMSIFVLFVFARPSVSANFTKYVLQ